MKKVFEFIVCFFHPVAVILAWLDLFKRTDLRPLTKLIWALLLVIPIIPFFYIFFSGDLW